MSTMATHRKTPHVRGGPANWRGLPTPSEGVPLVLERC